MAALAVQDLQDVLPLLKTVYLPIRKKGFKFLTPALSAATKGGPDRVKYAGNDLMFTAKMFRRGGFVASARGLLPDSSVARERQGRLGVSRLYGRVSVDGFGAAVTEDPKGAYISLAKKLTEDTMEMWEIEQTRMLYADGMAIRALVKSKTSETIWVLDSPYGISGAGPGGLHLTEGETIALHDVSNNNVVLGKAKILTITHSGDDATVTVDADLDGGVVGVAGDIIVTCVPSSTDTNDTSFGAEPYGFEAITDAAGNFSTFEQINDARWVAQKSTSATVDEGVIQKVLNTLRARAGVDFRTDPKAIKIFTTTGIWQQYGDSLLGYRRFNAPIMKIEGGYNAVAVAGVPLIDDGWCPRGRMYFIHTPDTIFVDLMDFGKLSYQDSVKWVQAPNQDAWLLAYGAYMGYGCTTRNSHAILSGITDTDNFSPIF